MTTNITIEGNLTHDPELRFTPSGKAVADFTVAVNERRRDETGEWIDDGATFYRCTTWDKLAENVAETLQKGHSVIVTGGLRNREYEKKDGGKGYSLEIRVTNVGPSLKWATATIARASRGSTPPAEDPWAPAPAQPQRPPARSSRKPTKQPSSGWDTSTRTQPPLDEEPPF